MFVCTSQSEKSKLIEAHPNEVSIQSNVAGNLLNYLLNRRITDM